MVEARMARVLSMGVNGVNGFPVHVEVFSQNGIPGMEIIGKNHNIQRQAVACIPPTSQSISLSLSSPHCVCMLSCSVMSDSL